MATMFVLELLNNPGDALTVPLAGSPSGYRSWITAVGSGVREEYVIAGSDGQIEWGLGYPTAASPNSFTRETVLGGSLGPGQRVAFVGQAEIYSDIIPSRLNEYVDSLAFRRSNYQRAAWYGQVELVTNAYTSFTNLAIPTGTRRILAGGSSRGANSSSTGATALIRLQIHNAGGLVTDLGDCAAMTSVNGIGCSTGFTVATEIAAVPAGHFLHFMACKDSNAGPFYLYNVFAAAEYWF